MDEIELDDELKAAVLRNLRIRIGDSDTLGPRLAAKKAEKTSEGVLKLEGAVFSACEECENDEDLPWKIRAGLIEYNEPEGMARYKNAILDFYNVPVFYMPYFKHSVIQQPTDGFLMPRFGTSTSKGFEINNAYYRRFGDHQDATIRMRYMTKRGAMLGLEHRYMDEHFSSDTRSTMIDDKEENTTRSYIESANEYVFKKGRRAGLNLNLASDDTYLDEFHDRNPSYLTSSAYFEDASKNHYYSAQAQFFQNQQTEFDDGATAQVLPKFIYERKFNLNSNKKDNVIVNAEVQHLQRDEGTTTQRLVTKATYRDVEITNAGDKFTFEASMRADAYNISTDEFSNATTEDGFEYRALPQLSLSWERPFMNPNTGHKVTPMAMLVASPRGGNPSEIPNDDSVAYELDITNLFDTNRFAGYDRVETGPRFVYGLDNRWGEYNSEWRIFFGQSYRLYNDSDLPAFGGTETRASDWVGLFKGEPFEWMEASSRFRLDSSTFELRRSDTTVRFEQPNTDNYVDFTHSMLDGGPAELSASGFYRINKDWDIEAEIQRDLNDGGKLLEASAKLSLTEQCYRLSFEAKRRGYTNDNVSPSTDFMLNLELLTLGRYFD